MREENNKRVVNVRWLSDAFLDFTCSLWMILKIVVGTKVRDQSICVNFYASFLPSQLMYKRCRKKFSFIKKK